jgi:hypothetical protein
MSDASCHCSRADWLDEMVPRARARTELLTHLERWAREREIFETGDLERACRVNVPMPTEPHQIAWEISPHLREYLRMGGNMAQSIVRQTYQQMAVRAINMRKECAVRLAALEAAKPKAAPEPEPAPRPAGLAEQLAMAIPAGGVVTLQTAGERL